MQTADVSEYISCNLPYRVLTNKTVMANGSESLHSG